MYFGGQGIEVKSGETVKCEPGDDKYLHLSQASLGEVKKEKENENIPIHLKVDNQKLVIGTLSADKCPQIIYDLVFEKEFELSHSWKNGSVFFTGYKTEFVDEGPDDLLGKSTSKHELAKTKATAVKADPLAAKPSAETEDSDEEDDLSEEDESDDEDMMDGEDVGSDEDDDEDESSEEEDEPSPKKAETGKKRTAESALKTPASNKKAKLVVDSGQKTGGHKATPHPAKQAVKTPATSGKSMQQTPKSATSVTCKSCSKTFKDDNALQAHTKAKHSDE